MLLDLLVWSALLFPLSGAISSGNDEYITAVVMNSFTSWMLVVGIYCYLLSARGQTVGKWLLRLNVVCGDGRRVGLGRLLLRHLIPAALLLIPYVGPLLLILDLAPAYGRTRTALHDRLLATRVAKYDRPYWGN